MARKKKRPPMTTKEELIAYLEQNKDTELPFNEVVWDLAVKATEDKERQFKVMSQTEFDGSTKTKKIPNGAVNPVSKYFQMIALPQYQKPMQDEIIEEEDSVIISTDDDEKSDFVDGLLGVFFSGYPSQDKKLIKERLSDYYDNYELNEGADKLLVIKAVADELEMANLTKKRIKGVDVEARLEKVQKGYLSLLESLKALKKQRSAMDDEGKNKLTLWVDELEKAGEFIYEFDTHDDIDEMLDNFEKSMQRVYSEG